jgi:hypothetical protein
MTSLLVLPSFTAAISLACAQDTSGVVVYDLRQHGLSLVPLSTSTAADFVLANNTPKSVIAIGVRWSYRMPPPATVQQHDHLYLNPDLAPLIQGYERTPPIEFGVIGRHRIKNGAKPLSVELDLVIFGDGISIGADHQQGRDNIHAKIDATRDLAATIVTRRAEKTDTEMSLWIGDLKRASYDSRPVPQRSAFERPHYRQWYFFYQNEAIMILEGVGKNLGWPEAFTRAEQELRKPPMNVR